LSRISPFLNPVTHTTVAEIEITNSGGRLRPGMFVAVDVHYGESEKATLVPLSALYEDPVSGGTGLYVSRTALEEDPSDDPQNGDSRGLIGPVQFDFVPVEVIAKGRMRAGISGVKPGQWVVTLGQDLLQAQSGQAKVRMVEWDWVEQLQQMQRQELLRDVMKRQQAQKDFMLSVVMAVILIYMVMAAQFERFLDPMIVMASVPLAFVGVVPTLLLTGTSLNMQSLMGIVMLIGIVVNNAIVLVDYINLMRREQNLDIRGRGDLIRPPPPSPDPDDDMHHRFGDASFSLRDRGRG
jgi:hypothetical protein